MIAARFARKLAATIAAGALLLSSAADACTGIRLTAADGTVVHARTLEFAVDIHSDVIVSPRGFTRAWGSRPTARTGLHVESEIRQRRRERSRPAGHHRRAQRGGARRRTVLLPHDRRIHGLRAGGRGKDHCALAARIVDPRQFRQRRRGQGEYRLDHRRCDRAQAMGLFAACARHRPRRLGQEHRHRICRRQAQRL